MKPVKSWELWLFMFTLFVAYVFQDVSHWTDNNSDNKIPSLIKGQLLLKISFVTLYIVFIVSSHATQFVQSFRIPNFLWTMWPDFTNIQNYFVDFWIFPRYSWMSTNSHQAIFSIF